MGLRPIPLGRTDSRRSELRNFRAPHALLNAMGEGPSSPSLAASTALLALVMPLHPPKLQWASRFIDSIRGCPVAKLGWFPVFSTVRDWQQAVPNVSHADRVVDLVLHLIIHPARGNPYTSKKWLALRYVFSQSKIPYALALDAEVAFVSPAPEETLRRWITAATSPRVFFGTAEFAKAKWWPPQYNGRPILRATHESCSQLSMTQDEWARLNGTGVLESFWWFSDAPLYERAHFHRFWSRLIWRPTARAELSWYVFDHVVYSCFLILTGEAQLVSVDGLLRADSLARSRGTGDLCCGMEIAAVTEQQQLAATSGHSFMWSHAAMLARETGKLPPRLLAYHIDRCEDGGACRKAQRQRLRGILDVCSSATITSQHNDVGNGPPLDASKMKLLDVRVNQYHRHQPTSNVAIVTLIVGTDEGGWLEGARNLACSLERSRHLNYTVPSFDLLALCPLGTNTKIRAAGWNCVDHAPVPNPFARSNEQHPWLWDYTLKIAPFRMIEYDRVVVIDSDVLVVQPSALHELLRWNLPGGALLAVRDCPAQFVRAGADFDADEIQAGVFVARPSMFEYRRLIAEASQLKSVDESGQGFFSNYWRGRVVWLPNRFNYQRTTRCIGLYDLADGVLRYSPALLNQTKRVGRRQAEALVEKHLASNMIGLVHYHYQPKPWTCTTDKLAACGFGWPAGTTRVDALQRLWFQRSVQCSVHLKSIAVRSTDR